MAPMFKGSFRRKVLGVIVLLGVGGGCPWVARAQTGQPSVAEDSSSTDQIRPRNEFWPPFFSFFLPGLDQWWEGQWAEGAFFTGYALTGIQTALHVSNDLPDKEIDLDTRDDRRRQYTLGHQMYLFAGELSAYQSFRFAAESQKKLGHYGFLNHKDKLSDVLMAPVEFQFLKRPTTYLPLGVLVVLLASDINGSKTARKYIDGSDLGYTVGFSYQAGVGEEAFFRGFMMPVLRQQWQSDFWANIGTSVAFSAGHISTDNKFPLAQAVAGYYFGFLTIKNGWSVREAAFVHTWWDILVFTGSYLAQSNDERKVFLPLHLSYF